MNGPITETGQLTDALLERFAALIYAKCGMRITSQKRALLSNRLRRRLRATGDTDFESYYRRLISLPAQHPEWDQFLQEVTTHESYLFRDEAHWRWFQAEFLPGAWSAAERRERGRELRIWSAACSTGDEAYTIAACVAARLPQFAEWRVEILGTDIGVSALADAERGAFGARAMRLVPREFRQRFFEENRAGESWTARPLLRQMLTFRRHNLLEPLRARPFHAVFLKNVLIYFDAASKRAALQQIARMLLPGGYLICGAAEGVMGMLPGFHRIHPWLYQQRSEG